MSSDNGIAGLKFQIHYMSVNCSYACGMASVPFLIVPDAMWSITSCADTAGGIP